MMNLRHLVDGMSAAWQKQRAQTQLTLGKLIQDLKAMPENSMVANLANCGSYRGCYEDMFFELGDGVRPASELLAECNQAMGQVFEGYKGGDFVMGALTPLWIAEYGNTGKKLIAVKAHGEIEMRDDD
jgi:hypothetical protein